MLEQTEAIVSLKRKQILQHVDLLYQPDRSALNRRRQQNIITNKTLCDFTHLVGFDYYF